MSDPPRDRTVSADFLETARAQVSAGLAKGTAGGVLLLDYSDSIDQLIRQIAAPAFAEAPPAWGPMCLAAIGGLGRRELGPYADLDLVLVAPQAPHGTPPFDTFVRELVHPIWDTGLRANVMADAPQAWLDEAAADLTLCTGLLDLRPIVGGEGLVEQLREQAFARFFGEHRGPFLERLSDEVRERHAKYGGTVYLVEPDIKHGPGGLRDLAVMRWALGAAYGCTDIEVLVRDGKVPPNMAASLVDARDVLLSLRAAMHLAAKRAQERFGFQYQEQVPPLLMELPGDVSDAELVLAIEQVMQGYYRSAQVVLRYGHRLRDRCRPVTAADHGTTLRLDERFAIRQGRLVHEPAGLIGESPAIALDALAFSRDYHAPLSGATFDAIAEVGADPVATGLALDHRAQVRFLDLLTHCDDVGRPSALELTNELGFVEALVPEFGPIRGRMQHDSYHVYTVDQHTLAAVSMLKRIARGEHTKDYPLATAVLLEVEDPSVLYLATLVHDAGKATGGDQCETGRDMAYIVAQRAGFSASQSSRCARLVGEHLEMPMLSQKRDLSDPLLIAEFAYKVHDKDTLRELYLLSLVDTASVRPGNLTAWKLSLLDELYLRTRAHLKRGTSHVRYEPAPRDEPRGMPARYYSLFHLGLRREHGRLVQVLREREAQVLLQLDVGMGTLRLTLVAHDRKALLAHAAAVLDDHGVEVLAADAFSTSDEPKMVVDVFRVAAKEGEEHGIELETIEAIERALQTGLDATAIQSSPGPRAMRPWERRAPIPTTLRFDTDPAGERTIVEIETATGFDVLRRVTLAFAAEGIVIGLARILVEAQRAVNVFYVARLEERRVTLLSERLHRYLDEAS